MHPSNIRKTTLSTNGKKIGRPVEWTEEAVDALGQDLIDWFEEDEERVYILGWIVKNGFYCEQVARFQRISGTFRDFYKRAKSIQQYRLATRLITSKTVPAGLIFALKNVSDWADKREVTSVNTTTIKVDRASLAAQPTEEILEQIKKMTSGEKVKN